MPGPGKGQKENDESYISWATAKVKRNTANLLRIHAFVPGHGWMPFTAANEYYAEGLSLYQHKKIGEWVAQRDMAFSTEKEQLVARHAFVEHVQEMAPDMATRERRATARMTREGGGEDIQHVFQEDDAVIHVDSIDERDDTLINPKRKGRSKGSGSGTAKEKPNTTIDDAALLLEQLRGLDWNSPLDEDQVMEEHA